MHYTCMGINFCTYSSGFGACFVVPEVVQINHFSLWQYGSSAYIGEKRPAFVCKRNSRSYPNSFF